MFHFFRLIFLRNIRAVLTLFFVLVLAQTGFLVIRQVTENVENQVASQVGPIFGADIIVSPRSYTPVPIIDQVAPILSGSNYSWGERTEFSSTLLDREGKTGLVKVIAYTGTYPQKGILETTPSLAGQFIAATPNILDRFATNSGIILDGITLNITHTINQSSDIGFSFGTDNALLILPREYLSGSHLISSGSRLDQDLLLTFPDARDIKTSLAIMRDAPSLSGSRIRSADERSERTLSTTEDLANYILLILVVAALFAGIILRSAHDGLFSELSKSLSIMEILGFSRKRQMRVFALFYILVIPGSFLLSILVSWLIIASLRFIPEAADFIFVSSPIFFTLIISSLLIVSTFLPAWGNKIFGERLSITLFGKTFSLIEGFPMFFGIFGIVFVIFGSFLWSFIGVLGAGILLVVLRYLLEYILTKIFGYFSRYRNNNFWRYDAFRTLVRPGIPTVPLIVSIFSIASFFIVFVSFSLSFRDKLVTDTRDSANIYAINILDEDIPNIKKIKDTGELYGIIRARIVRINNKSLSEHLSTPEPTGEFTREFNVTSDDLDVPLVSGRKILSGDEMSIDQDFAERLGVSLGDTVELSISGRNFPLKVVNIRSSVREGFRPFFYFQLDSKTFEKAPKTYFLSVYSTDIESWKKEILAASGPHVTFVDIENILSIARDVASKILSVISLFFLFISIFGILAIFSLFARFAPIESMKRRLYPLFGGEENQIYESLVLSRILVLMIACFFSLILGFVLSYFALSTTSFFSYSWMNGGIVLLGTIVLFALFARVIRPRR